MMKETSQCDWSAVHNSILAPKVCSKMLNEFILSLGPESKHKVAMFFLFYRNKVQI